VDAIAGEWRGLEAAAATPVLFQSFDWCRALIETAHRADRRSGAPAIVVARRGGRLVALLPLSVRRAGPVAVAHLVGHPLAQYGEIVAASDDAEAAAALVAGLRSAIRLDVFAVRRVRQDSRLIGCLEAAGATLFRAGDARQASLSGFGDVAAFGAAV